MQVPENDEDSAMTRGAPAVDPSTIAAGTTEQVPESSTSGACHFLESWVRDHYSVVRRYAYRLSGDAGTADDLAQQAFLQAWRHAGQLREPSRVKPWLLAVVRNQFLKGMRRERPVTFSRLGLDEASGNWTESSPATEPMEQLLDGLDLDSRTIVLMFYVEGLSYREIADRLGLAAGTVMSRLFRAKKRLRQLLDPEE